MRQLFVFNGFIIWKMLKLTFYFVCFPATSLSVVPHTWDWFLCEYLLFFTTLTTICSGQIFSIFKGYHPVSPSEEDMTAHRELHLNKKKTLSDDRIWTQWPFAEMMNDLSLNCLDYLLILKLFINCILFFKNSVIFI